MSFRKRIDNRQVSSLLVAEFSGFVPRSRPRVKLMCSDSRTVFIIVSLDRGLNRSSVTETSHSINQVIGNGTRRNYRLVLGAGAQSHFRRAGHLWRRRRRCFVRFRRYRLNSRNRQQTDKNYEKHVFFALTRSRRRIRNCRGREKGMLLGRRLFFCRRRNEEIFCRTRKKIK